jgi:hypothetical protein
MQIRQYALEFFGPDLELRSVSLSVTSPIAASSHSSTPRAKPPQAYRLSRRAPTLPTTQHRTEPDRDRRRPPSQPAWLTSARTSNCGVPAGAETGGDDGRFAGLAVIQAQAPIERHGETAALPVAMEDLGLC